MYHLPPNDRSHKRHAQDIRSQDEPNFRLTQSRPTVFAAGTWFDDAYRLSPGPNPPVPSLHSSSTSLRVKAARSKNTANVGAPRSSSVIQHGKLEARGGSPNPIPFHENQNNVTNTTIPVVKSIGVPAYRTRYVVQSPFYGHQPFPLATAADADLPLIVQSYVHDEQRPIPATSINAVRDHKSYSTYKTTSHNSGDESSDNEDSLGRSNASGVSTTRPSHRNTSLPSTATSVA